MVLKNQGNVKVAQYQDMESVFCFFKVSCFCSAPFGPLKCMVACMLHLFMILEDKTSSISMSK